MLLLYLERASLRCCGLSCEVMSFVILHPTEMKSCAFRCFRREMNGMYFPTSCWGQQGLSELQRGSCSRCREPQNKLWWQLEGVVAKDIQGLVNSKCLVVLEKLERFPRGVADHVHHQQHTASKPGMGKWKREWRLQEPFMVRQLKREGVSWGGGQKFNILLGYFYFFPTCSSSKLLLCSLSLG